MPLADLLGSPDNLLGLPPRPSYGGYQFDLPQQQAASQAMPQAAMPAYRQPSGIRRFLDGIGDALLVANGGQPIHRQHMQEAQAQSALQGFLTNPNEAIAKLMQVDAPSGIALWKALHPASEVPDTAKIYEYRQKLPPEQRGEFDKVTASLHPGMFAPVTMGDNDHVEQPSGASGGTLPHVTDQSSYDAVPSGSQYTTPDGKIRTKGGSTASAPSSGFPVSKVLDALTAQESGGNGLAVSSAGARGSTQLMGPTAKQMAGKLGLAFVPSMLHSNDPKALKYQRSLAEAYLTEGLEKTGNLRDALRYYHGGPDTSMWGPKTNSYADAILSRLGGR